MGRLALGDPGDADTGPLARGAAADVPARLATMPES